MTPMMLFLTVEPRVAIRECAEKSGNTTVVLGSVLPLLTAEDRETLSDSLVMVTTAESYGCDSSTSNVFAMVSPQGGYSPLAMSTTRITPEVVAAAIRVRLGQLRTGFALAMMEKKE